MQGDPKGATETSPSDAQASKPPTNDASLARGILDKPIASGIDFVEGFARSARGFADDLDGDAPQLARIVRQAASAAEDFSHGIRDKSVEELVETAQDFARRQPALFAGVAAAAGFLLARVVKTGMAEPMTSRTRSGVAASKPAPPPQGEAARAQQSARTFHDA